MNTQAYKADLGRSAVSQPPAELSDKKIMYEPILSKFTSYQPFAVSSLPFDRNVFASK